MISLSKIKYGNQTLEHMLLSPYVSSLIDKCSSKFIYSTRKSRVLYQSDNLFTLIFLELKKLFNFSLAKIIGQGTFLKEASSSLDEAEAACEYLALRKIFERYRN